MIKDSLGETKGDYREGGRMLQIGEKINQINSYEFSGTTTASADQFVENLWPLR